MCKDIFEAVDQGSVDSVRSLIEQGADVNMKIEYDWTPLHHAIRYDSSVTMVKYLIESGADVNATDCDGRTPLDHADTEEKVTTIRMAGGMYSDELSR